MILINSPQINLVLLVLQTFIVTMFIGLRNRLWYTYVLFLVFLGGVLVIFIYIRSLASKVKVDNQYFNLLKVTLIFIVFILILSLRDSTFIVLNSLRVISTEDRIINNLMSMHIYTLYMFTVAYLLLTLYVVCTIVKLRAGPLRKFSFYNS